MISAALDHVWQSTLVALGAGLLALAFRKAPAAVRYGLWFTASVKFLVPFAALGALGRLLAPAVRPPLQASPDAVFIERATQPFSHSGLASPAAPMAHPAIAPAPASSGVDAAPALAHAAIALDPALILLGVWALGCGAVLIFWMARLAKVRSAVRQAAPVALDAPMPVLASPWMREPGLVGLWRPVLLVPDTLFDHIGRAEIDALVAHEACHLRRRDNLTAAIHMLVEALFWFHPLVWWIGARLIEERERACDEAVVDAGHDRAAYARCLVESSRLYLQSPLSCVAGASGSSLTQRVEMIMTAPPCSPLSRSRKILLLAAAASALAPPVAAGWLTSPAGQEAAAQVATIASTAAARIQAPRAAAASPAGSGSAEQVTPARSEPAPTAVADSSPLPPDGAAPSADRARPSPGTEDAVRRWIAGLQAHQPDYEDMSPALQEAARRQDALGMQMFRAFGALKGVRFVRVTPDGDDAYEADFAHARIEVLAGPLTVDGKLNRLRWRPIWAKNGAPPQPGLPLPPLPSAAVSPAPLANVEVSKASLTPVSAQAPEGGALVDIATAPVRGAGPSPLISDPVWIRLPLPTWSWPEYVYPADAERRDLPGRATMRCRVDNRGGLSGCVVTDETPAGLGFGKDALLLAPQYRLRTFAADGSPVQGRLVDVTVHFTPRYWARLLDGAGRYDYSKPPQLVRWVVNPGYIAPGAPPPIYPVEARTVGAAGEVVLHCRVKADGFLTDCAVARDRPSGLGFGQAALLAHIRLLRVETRALDGTPTAGRTVEVRYVINPPCNVLADREQRGCAPIPMQHPRHSD